MNDGKNEASAAPRLGVVGWVVLNLIAILWIRHELLQVVGGDAPPPGHEGPQLRVVAMSPDETADADDADRLTFVFNQDVVTEEELGKRLTWTPFKLDPEPRPSGQWSWVKPAVLEYKLAERLPPGNRFDVSASDDYVRWVGMPLVGDKEFSFSTRALAVKECFLHSQDHLTTKIKLRFNQPVDPNALDEGLVCRVPGSDENLQWELLAPEVGSEFSLSVATPEDRLIEMTLAEGLAPVMGSLGLSEPYSHTVRLSPVFGATDARAPYWRGIERSVSVHLRFNRELDATQPIPVVKITPETDPFTVSIHGNSLVLNGPFERGDGSYTARVQGAVLAYDGESSPPGAGFAFNVPQRSPTVNFPHSNGFLSPRGHLGLDLETAAVGTITFTAHRIYRNNLGHYLRGRTRFMGKSVANEEVPIAKDGGQVVQTVLDLKGLLGKEPLGVYHIGANAIEHRWTNDHAFVTITDLCLTTKRSSQGVFVWVTSLKDAAPVEGAVVVVHSDSNQFLVQGRTDATGVVELKVPADHPDGQPWLVTAEKDDDLSYRILDRRKWHLPDVAQGGRVPAEAYDLFLYPERGVYRPGDVVRLSGILRELDGSVPPEIPLEAHAWQPDGRKIKTWKVPLGEDALFHTEFASDQDGQTGYYRFAVGLAGSEEFFGETKVMVEAFQPIRIEAHATAENPLFSPGDEHMANLSARYLFGTPASNAIWVVNGSYHRVPYVSERYSRFKFQVLDGESVRRSSRNDGITDEAGNAAIRLDDTRIRNLPGLWEGRFYATVTMPGGRSVSDSFTFRSDPLGRHLGLAFPSDFPHPPGKSFDMEVVMVDEKDQPIDPVELEVLLERVDRSWVLQQVNGDRVWRRQETFTLIKRLSLPAEAEADPVRSVSLSCPSAGSFRVTARDLEGGARAQASFYVSAYGDRTDPALASPHRVTMKLEGEKPRAGEMASIRVVAPFAGRLLVSLETDAPIGHRVIMMEKPEAVVELPIPDSVRGSAFVSATVIRPLDLESPDWKPHRAYGLMRLPIDHSAQRLAVAVEGPSKVEPEEEVKLRVEVPKDTLEGGPAQVHLWAVDEGILLVSDHATPDPHGHFFAPRRNLVDSGDLYLELLPDYKRPASMDRTGAGGKGNVPPSLVKAQPRKPNVLWHTFAKTDLNGSYETTFTTPDFTGELRFMAVVVAGDAYGSSEHALTVTTPLLVEPSWPRFVAPGDRFRVPVKVFNETENACSAHLDFSLEGPVEADWESGSKVRLGPKESKTLWLSGKATDLGHVSAIVRVKAGELHADSKAKFFVRPASTLLVERSVLEVEAGEESLIEVPDSFVGEGVRTTVTVSPHPSVDLRPVVDRLMAYPHGCLEQTSSRIAPMLFAADLFEGAKSEYLNRMVKAGLQRLASMQTVSGGLSYWPRNPAPYTWGTCYASFLVSEAKVAGYEAKGLDQAALAKYLELCLRKNKVDLNQQAFLCRTLAVFDKPQVSRQSFLLDNLEKLDLAGRSHLASAWLACGRPDKAQQSLPEGTLELDPVARSTGGRLTSPIAQDAFLLMTLLSLDSKHPWIPKVVNRMELSRKTGGLRSTLDDGLAVAALSRYQAGIQKPQGDFKGTLGEKDGETHAFSSESPKRVVFKGRAPIRLTSEGSGPLYVSIKSEGVGLVASAAEKDSGIQVRRRWLDENGEVLRDWAPIDSKKGFLPLRLKVGQLVRVEVKLSTRGRGNLNNVAVVDALPGGMEVENPRLSTSAPRHRQRFAEPDRVEFLDDRVVLFASANGFPQTYSYSLRAISQGDFTLPPVQATCMYDSALSSMHGSGALKIDPNQ